MCDIMCDIPKVWLNNIIWKCVINIIYWANTQHPATTQLVVITSWL